MGESSIETMNHHPSNPHSVRLAPVSSLQRINPFLRPEVAGGCEQLEVQTGAIFELNQCLGTAADDGFFMWRFPYMGIPLLMDGFC